MITKYKQTRGNARPGDLFPCPHCHGRHELLSPENSDDLPMLTLVMRCGNKELICGFKRHGGFDGTGEAWCACSYWMTDWNDKIGLTGQFMDKHYRIVPDDMCLRWYLEVEEDDNLKPIAKGECFDRNQAMTSIALAMGSYEREKIDAVLHPR